MKKAFSAVKKYLAAMPKNAKLLLAAALLLCAVGLTGRVAVGKYISGKVTQGDLYIGSQLATSFKLLEHEAVQQTDGSYTLGAAEVTSNTYKLIPGLTIPKDPYISIVGKTPVSAYLYLEVIEQDIGFDYTVDSAYWTSLGVTGPHGGAVYAYTGGLIDDTSAGLDRIPILAGNSFTLGSTPVTGGTEALRFCGFLVQPTDTETTAAAAFNGKFAAVTP